MPTIEQIEDAIITALDPLKTTLEVRTIKTYQGELEFEDKEEIRRLARNLPALYIVYSGSPYVNHGKRKIERPVFTVFVVDKSLRLEAEARRGSDRNPGTYAMLEGVRDKLYGQQLSLEIWPFELRRVASVWFGGGISVFAAEYMTGQGHFYPA